jgi:hypothetical protein
VANPSFVRSRARSQHEKRSEDERVEGHGRHGGFGAFDLILKKGESHLIEEVALRRL